MSILLSGWGDDKAINIPDSEGNTTLILAAKNGRTDIVEALIKKGADINLKV